MNICMISSYPPQKGGVPVHTESLVSGLSKKHRIFLVTYGRLGRKTPKNVDIYEVAVPGIRFLRGITFFIGAHRAVKKILSENRIDIIHAQYMHPPGSLAACFAKHTKTKAKLVVTAHGSDLLSLAKGRLGRLIIKRVGNACDRLVCVSGFLERTAQSIGIRNTVVIPNGVGSALPKERSKALRKNLGMPADRRIITFAGMLTEAKGADIFMILADQLRHSIKDLQVSVVGGGPLEKELRKYVENNGMSGFVTFTGAVKHEKALRYMKASDLVVVPSRIEGFGLTALEAARMKVPVIALPNGALPEVLPECSVSENLPHLARKVLNDRKFRRSIVKENFRTSERYTLKRMCDETEKLYRSLS